ncbi:tetratricopeptide repeat protein [Kordiimonas lipolytica]|nr:hypothetical protein [Kordiimonas lipolytica]
MKTKASITIFLLVASTVAITSLTGAAAARSAVKDEDRYANCMDMADRSPDKGINLALAWIADGGGVPARHCEAYGLARLGEHAEAAARFLKIAEDMRIGRDMPIRMGKRIVASAPMLADMYGQAANAWLLADELVRAEDAIDLALTLAPKNTPQEYELVLDRARIAAADEDFQLALRDLDYVLKGDPGRKDILVLVAAAARGVGDYGRANQALEAFQAVFPNNASGYLELGNLRHAEADRKAARQAWLKVLLLEDQGPSADAARANIEKMDVQAADTPAG